MLYYSQLYELICTLIFEIHISPIYAFVYESFAPLICQEKNGSIQRQLDTVLYSKRQKSFRINDTATSDSLSVTSLQDSPGMHRMLFLHGVLILLVRMSSLCFWLKVRMRCQFEHF